MFWLQKVGLYGIIKQGGSLLPSRNVVERFKQRNINL